MKGVLIALKVDFPKTHDLADLLSLAQEAGLAIPEEIREAAQLSSYAVEARYPGLTEPVTRQEYQEAISIAKAVIRWAEEIIAESLPSQSGC